MYSVWKYTLLNDSIINMPEHAEVLHVNRQGDDVCVWARVDPAAPLRERRFVTFGTGHPMPTGPLKYIGTVHFGNGALVLHVFEIL